MLASDDLYSRWRKLKAQKASKRRHAHKNKKTTGMKGWVGPAGKFGLCCPFVVHPIPTDQRARRQLRNSLWISARALRWHVGVIIAPPDPYGPRHT